MFCPLNYGNGKGRPPGTGPTEINGRRNTTYLCFCHGHHARKGATPRGESGNIRPLPYFAVTAVC
jgi:hypothetical protein